MTWEQLSLFEIPGLNWDALSLRTREKYPVLRREIIRRRSRGRLAGSRRWFPSQWVRETGVHPLSLPPMERAGLIRWEGEDLVLVHYDPAPEERAERFSKLQAERAAQGNRMRAKAYRKAAFNARQEPDQEPDQVNALNSLNSLNPKPAMAALAAAPARGEDLLSECRSPLPEDRQTDHPPLPGARTRPQTAKTVEAPMTPAERRIWRALPEKRRWAPHVKLFLEACRDEVVQAGQHADEWIRLIEREKRRYADRMNDFPFGHALLSERCHLLPREPKPNCPCPFCVEHRSHAAPPDTPVPPPLVPGAWPAAWPEEKLPKGAWR